MINNEDTASIRACLKTLSPAQREAIHLAYYCGLTYADVAHRLGIPIPTAKTRIRDGLKKLSSCIGTATSPWNRCLGTSFITALSSARQQV
ncbi:sigma factor-like helix-turn-helix DNA-binding protein [Arthrobacter sp. B1805]|uniref:sigma factor-like helix-turn-helix DNA-binding protein n=1 Tax=Arthrobacter sp. B1805 TaxID=2058892 RepID=UPI0015E399E5